MGNNNGALMSQQITGPTSLVHNNQDFPANTVQLENAIESGDNTISDLSVQFQDSQGNNNTLVIKDNMVQLDNRKLDQPINPRPSTNQAWIHWDNTKMILLVSFGPIDLRDTRNCYRLVLSEEQQLNPVQYTFKINGTYQVRIGHMDQFKCFNEKCKTNWGIGPSNNSVQTNCAYFYLVDQAGNRTEMQSPGKVNSLSSSSQAYDQAYQHRTNSSQNSFYNIIWYILLSLAIIILIGFIIYMITRSNKKSFCDGAVDEPYADGAIGILPMNPINI